MSYVKKREQLLKQHEDDRCFENFSTGLGELRDYPKSGQFLIVQKLGKS